MLRDLQAFQNKSGVRVIFILIGAVILELQTEEKGNGNKTNIIGEFAAILASLLWTIVYLTSAKLLSIFKPFTLCFI